MKRCVMVWVVILTTLLGAEPVTAESCGIVNGGFEDDGSLPTISHAQEPNGWSVENIGNKFKGYVLSDWRTNGSYNLTLFSELFTTFAGGEMAFVSQQVYLDDVNQVTFDVKLAVSGLTQWDPAKCTAFVLIDGEAVWESNSVGSDVKGEYRDQAYTVEDKYRTGELHTLALGLRINVEEMLFGRYITHWDAVECSVFCGGAGPVEGDINDDCCVDALDLQMLADSWLSDGVDVNDPANLSHLGDDPNSYAIIDFQDFAVYAGDWDGSAIGLQELVTYWLEVVDPDYEYNLYGEGDIRARGEINFFDLAVLGGNWLQCSGSGEE